MVLAASSASNVNTFIIYPGSVRLTASFPISYIANFGNTRIIHNYTRIFPFFLFFIGKSVEKQNILWIFMATTWKYGVFQIFTAHRRKIKKTSFIRARAFAIHEFWGVIEEIWMKNKNVYADNGRSWCHQHHQIYFLIFYILARPPIRRIFSIWWGRGLFFS